MQRSHSQSGMTLVEIMVAVAIVALVAAVSVASIGSLGTTRLKGSAYLVAAAVQRGFSYSATHGQNARLVVDLDEQVLSLEGGEGKLVIDREVEGGVGEPGEDEETGKDPSSKTPEPAEQGFDLGVETLSEQIRSGFHSGEVPRYKPPVFAPIGDRRFDACELEPRVTFLAVYSVLYDEPRREGKAYVYFFPDGFGDHAVIQITNTSGEIFSVEVMPLMGRARVHNFAFVPDLEEEME